MNNIEKEIIQLKKSLMRMFLLVEIQWEKGANAIINVRLTTSMVMQGCSEILAYGTAVTVD